MIYSYYCKLNDATLCLLNASNLLLLHDSLHGFHHIPLMRGPHGTLLLGGCLTGLLLSATPRRLDNTMRLRLYGGPVSRITCDPF